MPDVEAVSSFAGADTVLRTAGQMHWSQDESQFCPMIVDDEGDTVEGNAVLRRKPPTINCRATRSEYKHSWHEHVWTWLTTNGEHIQRRNKALIYTGSPASS